MKVSSFSETKYKKIAGYTLSLFGIIFFLGALFIGPKEASAALFDTKPKCTNTACYFTPLVWIDQLYSEAGDFISPSGKYDTKRINVAKQGATKYLQNLYIFGIAMASALAVIMIVIGGVKYATTDAIDNKSEGKKTISAALTGLVLALLSYTLLSTINRNLVSNSFAPGEIAVSNSIADSAKTTPAVTAVTDDRVGMPFVDYIPNYAPNDGTWSTDAKTGLTQFINMNAPNTSRSSSGGLNFSNYGYDGDLTPDSNSAQARGNRANLLRDGSVALSPDLIEKYHPPTGAAVYVNNVHVGYYEDATGPDSVNTIDLYDPNASLGRNTFLRSTPSGEWNISFGTPRAQIPNPSR